LFQFISDVTTALVAASVEHIQRMAYITVSWHHDQTGVNYRFRFYLEINIFGVYPQFI